MGFIKKFFSAAKEGFFVLFYAFKDKRTPLFLKITAFFTAVYLVSPIDLIPDAFFPSGFLDDLAIVPSLLYFVYKKLPAEVLTEAQAKSDKTNKTIKRSIIVLFCAAGMAIFIFLVLLYLLYKLLFG